MVCSSRLLYIIRDVLSCGWYFKWYMQLHISLCNTINMWYFKEDSISKKFSTHRYFCRNVNFIGNESPILELRSWSWLSFGAILPHTYLDIIMSSLNTHLYTQLFRLYGQKTEKGQFFVQISTLLYAFKLSHAREFSSKVLDIQDFVWKDHSHQPEIWIWSCYTGTDLLSQILVCFHFHFQLLISALFQTVNFRHSQAFIYTKDVSFENILLIKR